ncbi:MAG: hypothetical protein M0P97_03165 [Candidatus Moranbacteria bacterium]|nr:hypothetical protein [Candidatus Moranbacteria bacterium]
METYAEYVSGLYARDIADGNKCRQLVKKQSDKHSLLVGLLRQVARPGDLVVAPGSGFGHEQGFFPEFDWLGLEFKSQLVAEATKARKLWGHRGISRQWDVYQDPLPEGNILYLCHFCGGGTDFSLFQAAQKGYRAVVVLSCCSHRMVDLSLKVHQSRCTSAEWEKLAKLSSRRGTSEGIDAQMQIDALRGKLLREQGFTVSQGWFLDSSLRPLPAGGFIIARR